MYYIKNSVQVIGYLGNKPEVYRTETGHKVTKFSVATNESWININGEKVSETHWHQVAAWNKLADTAERLLDKGKQVIVEGKLTYSDYEDKEGVKRQKTVIQARELLVLDPEV